MGFPYIAQIQVKDCYASQNFNVPHQPSSTFKHIILTGKNGSGKTTILNSIAESIKAYRDGKSPEHLVRQFQVIAQSQAFNSPPRKEYDQKIKVLESLQLQFLGEPTILAKKQTNDYIFSFFPASRKVNLKDVTTVTKEDEFYNKLNSKSDADFISAFKQYLVNKKVYEAFDFMNQNQSKISESQRFFDELVKTLRQIFKDEKLTLEFVQEKFEFYIVFSDSRKVTFNQLSEGFSAFLSIIAELIMRVDLLRKQSENWSWNPEGIILIDEPETHFHLSMQYEILPLIVALFPKLQMIIATHSPSIISSLKNAVVYDLSSQQEVSDWLLGSSYSELMISHFGLENEFSPVADKILSEVNKFIINKNTEGLRQLLVDNEKYLTPSLKLEIESQIIKLRAAQ